MTKGAREERGKATPQKEMVWTTRVKVRRKSRGVRVRREGGRRGRGGREREKEG